MTRSKSQLMPCSHDELSYQSAAQGRTRRWRAGYQAQPDTEPGIIRVTHTVAQQICRDHQAHRADTIAAYLAEGKQYYEDALAHTDAVLPRIYLDGVHLIADYRHVQADSDAIRSVEPDPDGWYRIGLGYHWYPVGLRRCDTVGQTDHREPSTVVLVAQGDLDAAAAAHRAGNDVIWRCGDGQYITVRPLLTHDTGRPPADG